MSTVAWEPLLHRNRELASYLGENAEGLLWLDGEGRILWANEAVLSLLGGEPGGPVGHTLAELVAPDERSIDLLRRLRVSEPLHNELVSVRGSDGPVRLLLSSSGWWDDGLLVHSRRLTSSSDLSDAQRGLVESERRFRRIYEGAPEAVVIIDDQGRFVEANAAACALHHQGKEYLRGQFLRDLVKDPAALDAIRARLRDESRVHGEIELRRADGPLTVAYAAESRFLPGRQAWVMRDVTRRRDESRGSSLLQELERAREDVKRLRVEAELAHDEAEIAGRARDEFLATLSHELRTPLNAIVGWSHLLRTGDVDRATLERGLETIERNARAQSQLIAEILDVSRMVTGNLRLNLQPVALGDAIHGAVEGIRPAAKARGVVLDVPTDMTSDMVAGDPARLQQVAWNLLSNAVKFSGPGDHVRLRVEPAGSVVRLVVEDTGEGIAPEVLPHVFERFRQGDSSSTRRHGGLGLGLAITRHLVELHGGSVAVESPGRGGGSRFTVTLPLLESQRQEAG